MLSLSLLVFVLSRIFVFSLSLSSPRSPTFKIVRIVCSGDPNEQRIISIFCSRINILRDERWCFPCICVRSFPYFIAHRTNELWLIHYHFHFCQIKLISLFILVIDYCLFIYSRFRCRSISLCARIMIKTFLLRNYFLSVRFLSLSTLWHGSRSTALMLLSPFHFLIVMMMCHLSKIYIQCQCVYDGLIAVSSNNIPYWIFNFVQDNPYEWIPFSMSTTAAVVGRSVAWFASSYLAWAWWRSHR